jgi:hypothetical protein
MSDQIDKTMHPVIPLAVLETLRLQDVPQPDGLDEFHVELSTKRLGMSHTVERQIDRFRQLMADGTRVPTDEVTALFRLAGRRPDADLLFADAGRRAGAMVTQRSGGLPRVVPGVLRRRLRWRAARRVLRRTFDLHLVGKPGAFTVDGGSSFTAHAVPDGSACGFLGAAAASVLRACTGFEGAVVHGSCRAAGADSCRWEAAGLRKV